MVFGRRLVQRIDALQARIDRDVTPALDNLARLQSAGLYRDDLSFDHVDRIAVNIALRELPKFTTFGSITGCAPRDVSSSRQPRSIAVGPDMVPLPNRSPGRRLHPSA